MDLTETDLPGVMLITPGRHGDHRGFFSESWNARRMSDAGLDVGFVQDNESLSAEPGTLRGLHYQAPPFAQTKLVRVVAGAILDVAVDARRGSPTYGKWIGAELSAENGTQILVPRGFLHGFVTLKPQTHVLYKVDNFYDRDSDGGVIWNDPDLGVDWGVKDAIVSEKDTNAPRFSDWSTPFVFGEDA